MISKSTSIFRTRSGRLIVSGSLLCSLALVLQLAFSGRQAFATACGAPTTNNGRDTLKVTVPSGATYSLWVHMLVPDSADDTVEAQIDNATCFDVGGGSSIPARTWTWVDYQNGATETPDSVSLAAGSHTLTLIGTSSGVEVDHAILTSDATCMPTGTGDNCMTSSSNAPSVSLSVPTNSATLGSTTSGIWGI